MMKPSIFLFSLICFSQGLWGESDTATPLVESEREDVSIPADAKTFSSKNSFSSHIAQEGSVSSESSHRYAPAGDVSMHGGSAFLIVPMTPSRDPEPDEETRDKRKLLTAHLWAMPLETAGMGEIALEVESIEGPAGVTGGILGDSGSNQNVPLLATPLATSWETAEKGVWIETVKDPAGLAGGVNPVKGPVQLERTLAVASSSETQPLVTAFSSFAPVVTEQFAKQIPSVKGHNPQEIFANLNRISSVSTSDLSQDINTISALNPVQLTAALDQLHPAQLGVFDLLNENTTARIAALSTEQSESVDKKIWVAPFGYLYNQEKIGEQLGFTAHAIGVVTGLHLGSHESNLGVSAAYSSSVVHWHEKRGQGRMDKVSLNVYIQRNLGLVSIDGVLGGGWDLFNAHRKLSFSTIHRSAQHEQGGYDISAHLGARRAIPFKRFEISFFGKMDYSHLYQGGFTERGAGALNLKVQGRHADTLRSECGLKLASSWKLKQGYFTPSLHVSGINMCYFVPRHYRACFHQQALSYAVRTFNHPIYLVAPGLDLQFQWGRGLYCSLNTSVELNSRIVIQNYAGYLGWSF